MVFVWELLRTQRRRQAKGACDRGRARAGSVAESAKTDQAVAVSASRARLAQAPSGRALQDEKRDELSDAVAS
ncbi:hypothetical protein C5Y97_29035 [Blastopirellula marina]|uniref:Uncharacterized protein n=1 Tax=Blastopirellula marina TaxID=124 RepID=A0A2S8F3X2_9BACT|nr:hypothetical protein C5Y98_29020 [Blastopirellula marina]PQO41504.1 hypothetical protein C5Y93_30820 [Blastopirellula marina]PTL41024.1 hypothetical protein C5Y97_29035 [Blastopirellula marina]